MKDSHFRTPRTMGECSFRPDMDPFERHRVTEVGHRVAAWFGAAVIAVLFVALISGGI